MNIFICDDDKRDIARLKEMIDKYDSEHQILSCSSGGAYHKE